MKRLSVPNPLLLRHLLFHSAFHLHSVLFILFFLLFLILVVFFIFIVVFAFVGLFLRIDVLEIEYIAVLGELEGVAGSLYVFLFFIVFNVQNTYQASDIDFVQIDLIFINTSITLSSFRSTSFSSPASVMMATSSSSVIGFQQTRCDSKGCLFLFPIPIASLFFWVKQTKAHMGNKRYIHSLRLLHLLHEMDMTGEIVHRRQCHWMIYGFFCK